MAPEVKTGNYSFPSDIYSMGLVLYEIFEKKLPDYDPDTQKTTVPKKFDVCWSS
jgi:serine/threonine protein kinase